jgi:streptomycin 6-kinase
MPIPERLRWLERDAVGRAWLAELPTLTSALARKWNLELGAPFEGASVSYVVRAMRGTDDVVLKVQWPHEESMYEADALHVWDGCGAVRLLDHDPERHALLLERCRPGTSLADTAGVDALAVLIALLPRLWKSVGSPFKSLTKEALEWKATLHADWEAAGRPCERKLVDAATELLGQLLIRPREPVLVHQDLHGENVLAAEREPWLVIDPKPLRGEREFSLAPIIRSAELGHTRDEVVYRLDRLSTELQLDRERVRGWTIAQTMAWGLYSNGGERHFETIRWLLAAP